MAEPQRKIYDDEDDDKSLSAQQRANRRWGIEQSPTQPENDKESQDKSARERADDKWGMSPEDIKNAEENADSTNTTGADKKEASELGADDQIGDGYNENDKKRLASLVANRKKVIGGGVAGILVAGAIGLGTIFSGPLQFVHIAQLLQRFHFLSAQENTNSRVLKLYKWSKNAKTDTIENTRLSIIGRRFAIKIDTRLAEIGIQKNYSSLGTYQGTTIDPKIFSENAEDGNVFKRLGEQDFINKFQEQYGIKIKPAADFNVSNKFVADEDGFFSAYFKNRRLNKMLVKQAGYDNMGSSIIARIMGVRDSVTLHPIRRVDSKITGAFDEKFTAWLSQMKERIRSGEPTKVSATGGEVKDSDGKTDTAKTDTNNSGADNTNSVVDNAVNVEAQSEDDVARGITNAGDDVGSGVISKLAGSTGGKLALGGTAVIGIACAIQGIAKAADGVKHDLVVLPLVRTGMQAISLGNQVMSGQDLDITKLGFFSKQLTNPKTGAWNAARSIQAEQGQNPTGPDIPDAANVGKIMKGSMFSQILGKVPGLDGVCSVVNSGIGSFAMTVVGLVTGPVATVGGLLVSQSGVLNGPMSSLVRWMAGKPIPTFVTGADYGNYINYGARLAANDSMASMGGAELSNAQALELKNYHLAMQKQDMSSETFAERVLDPYSPDSLVGKAVDNVSPNIGSNVASLLTNIGNPLKIFGSLKLPLTQKAFAASSSEYDYGFPEVGFSLGDLNSSTYDNPYDNANKAIALLRSSEDYRNRIEKCFGVTFSSTDGALTTQFTSIDPTNKDYPDSCSKTDENWTRIRFYVLDMKTAEATDCFESGDNTSCHNSGFGSSSTTTNTPTATVGSVNGYKNPFRDVHDLKPLRIDQGVDYAGNGPVYALGNATIIDANPHSQWPGGNWISYQLDDGPAAGKFVFVAEDCTIKVAAGQHVNADTVLCNMFTGGPNIEIGWAEPGLSERAMAHNIYHEGLTTQLGVNFSDLLKKLGAPGGILTNDVSNVPIPTGWSTW